MLKLITIPVLYLMLGLIGGCALYAALGGREVIKKDPGFTKSGEFNINYMDQFECFKKNAKLTKDTVKLKSVFYIKPDSSVAEYGYGIWHEDEKDYIQVALLIQFRKSDENTSLVKLYAMNGYIMDVRSVAPDDSWETIRMCGTSK